MSEIDISGNVSSQPLTFYNLEFNIDRTLDIDGKQIVLSRLTNPATVQKLNWSDLFDKQDWTSAIINNTQPNILRVSDTLRMVDLSGNNPRNILWNSNPATTLDISANPLENFEYNLSMVRRGAGTDRTLYIMDPSASNLVTYNGSLGQLTCPQFLGNIHSQANSANQVHYLTFVDSASTGFGRLQKNSGLSFNPNSGVLTATTFSGDLSGNATNATNSTNATNATNANITSVDVNATYYPVLSNGTGNQALVIDSITTPFSYNPNQATLTIGSTTVSNTNVTTTNLTATGRLNLTYNSIGGTFASGTLTLAIGTGRSFQNFTWTMTANITALSLTGTFSQNGSFNVFITGHATTNYTIGIGGTGNLGASILTSWSTAQTITANSKNLITIHYDGDKYYLRGTFGLTG